MNVIIIKHKTLPFVSSNMYKSNVIYVDSFLQGSLGTVTIIQSKAFENHYIKRADPYVL